MLIKGQPSIPYLYSPEGVCVLLCVLYIRSACHVCLVVSGLTWSKSGPPRPFKFGPEHRFDLRVAVLLVRGEGGGAGQAQVCALCGGGGGAEASRVSQARIKFAWRSSSLCCISEF